VGEVHPAAGEPVEIGGDTHADEHMVAREVTTVARHHALDALGARDGRDGRAEDDVDALAAVQVGEPRADLAAQHRGQRRVGRLRHERGASGEHLAVSDGDGASTGVEGDGPGAEQQLDGVVGVPRRGPQAELVLGRRAREHGLRQGRAVVRGAGLGA
jgi:hypothetical protein